MKISEKEEQKKQKQLQRKEKRRLPEGFATMLLFLSVIGFLFVGVVANHDVVEAAFSSEWKKSGKTPASVAKAFQAAEPVMDQSIPGRKYFINLYGLVQRLMGKKWLGEKYSYNDIYKMDNGQLTYAYPDYDVKEAAEQYEKLLGYCKTKATKLLYIQWPYKVNQYNNHLPHGMEDYSNKNCDKFLKLLEEMGADTLDYREVLQASNKDYASLFFDTDHHWRMETAFDAYRYLLSFLRDTYGFTFDTTLLEPENYNFVTLPHSFIGSLANRSGTWYAGVDDFTYIYPAFDTEFVWEKYSPDGDKLISRKGEFEKTLLFKKSFTDPKTAKPYRDNCYFNGNPALVKIWNKKVKGGRILCIVDSYSKPVASFLSLAFERLDFMDLRDFSKIGLFSYLEENSYDYILVAYSAAAFKKTTCPKFFHFSE